MSTLRTALQTAPMLKGFANIYLGRKEMARTGGAPRIVLFPARGKIQNPRNHSTANRDVLRVVVAHLWAADLDQMEDLETRFVQALAYQAAGGNPVSPASAVPGLFWSAEEEVWETEEDSDSVGEELYIPLFLLVPLDQVPKKTGTVDSILYQRLSTTLGASMLSTDTAATVASTVGFPPTGLVLIDSEQMLFTGVTPTSLTGLIRGVNGTTAATHSSGATVNVS